ncbi:MAG TPA: MFS transporter, partial [Anaeromyxobacter sp.]
MPEPPLPTPPARPTPPFLFLFLDLPFGAAVGYATVAMPWWLRQGGLSLAEIGALSATAFAPHGLKLLWVPAVDLLGTRRSWYLAMCAATAALLVAASLVPDPVRNLWLYGALVTLAQATATTGHVANSALMAITTRFEDKGKAAGFSMASNLGGTGLLGA